MNKKGFIRTLEAVLAIIVVFLFIYYVGRSGTDQDLRSVESVKSLQESILGDISRNDVFRECMVTTVIDNLEDIGKGILCPEISTFIENSLPPRFKGNKHKFTVCDPTGRGSCSLPTIKEGKVYTSAVIITSSVQNGGTYAPRILRIWLY